ncbi:MAG TPA: HAMP domain-containing sensor histidine kinase [Bryobacteraceae bacterium]|nr:HAMP domain-containing sensor histidine kinase [Bryobacteraceae bacterium]
MKTGRSVVAQWVFITVLALCCTALTALEYRWTGQITRAERDRLRGDLHERLLAFRRDFDESILEAMRGLAPRLRSGRITGGSGATVQPCPFRRAGLAVFHRPGLEWLRHDPHTGGFVPDQLPPEWSALRSDEGAFPGALELGDDVLIADLHGVNRGGRGGPEPFSPRTLLVAEIDRECLGQKLIPALAGAHFANGGHVQYDMKIVSAWSASSKPIYVSSASAAALTRGNAEDSIVLDLDWHGPGPPEPRARGFRRPPPEGRGEAPPGAHGPFGGPPPGDHGKQWLLLVRHKTGSLEALVENERRWNLALSGGMLLLIFVTGLTLVRLTRASQRLSELRMNIVAGVSHELRSPLTVIRTAAFNLQREGLSSRPEQVRRYGELIGAESTRLERLVENVLRFAAMGRERAADERESIDVAELLESELDFFKDVVAANNVEIERNFSANLPRVFADPAALRHAIRNILENAIKYGGQAGWIGVSAGASGDAIAIRIADRGPGIPEQERTRIFEPFFRGGRAIRDQIQGAGLGLSLATEIVRAQGGSIEVAPESAGGAVIVIRLPLAPGGRAAL